MLVLTLLWIPSFDCKNNREEVTEGAEYTEDICYKEPNLSRGVEGIDYVIAYDPEGDNEEAEE
jgi:hypothetical protein